MTFTKVDEVPKYEHKQRHKLGIYLKEFMASNIKVAKVNFVEGEYKSLKSAHESLRVAAKRWVLPIDVVKRGDEVFLVRRDI